MTTVIWAAITLKSKLDSSLKSVYVTKRESAGVVSSGDLTDFIYPILKSTNSFGSAMNNYLPNASNGSLVLDCSRESFGYERRFIDLLERYTIQNQECTLSAAEIDPNEILELPLTADYEISLLMRGWSYSPSAETITISLSGESLTSSIVTYTIKKNLIFDNGDTLEEPAPESLGRSLPVVFGRNVEVASYRIENSRYAYAATPKGHSYDADEYKCLLPNLNNEYVEIESKVNTNILGKTYASGAGHDVFDVSTNFTKVAYPFTLTERALVDKIGVYIDSSFTGSVGGSPNQVALDLCLADGDKIPAGSTIESYSGGDLAPGTVIAGGFTAIESFTLPATEMIVSFANPVVLEKDTLYWIVWDLEKDKQYSTSWTKEVYFLDNVTNNQGDVRAFFTLAGLNRWESIAIAEGNQIRCYYSVYGIRILDRDVRFGFERDRVPRVLWFTESSNITVNGTRSVGGVFPANLTNLKPVVIRNEGLLDTSTGTVTGTNNALIEKPEHVAKMISRLRDPSAIVANEIDTTQFTQVSTNSEAYDYRVAGGAFQGRTTYDRALRDLCRSTQTRIARRKDGFYFYAEGIRQPTVTRYEDSECRILSVRELNGSRSIVNNAQIYYQRSLVNTTVGQGASDGSFQNFKLNSVASDADSISVYGDREILVEAMEMISDQISGDRVSKILVDKWGEPSVFVDMAVPLSLARGVDLLDVIEIVSAELHAFFGTSYNAKGPTYDGALVDQGSMPEKRAKKWRGIVEGRDISGFEGGATELILSVRLFAPNDINF